MANCLERDCFICLSVSFMLGKYKRHCQETMWLKKGLHSHKAGLMSSILVRTIRVLTGLARGSWVKEEYCSCSRISIPDDNIWSGIQFTVVQKWPQSCIDFCKSSYVFMTRTDVRWRSNLSSLLNFRKQYHLEELKCHSKEINRKMCYREAI